MSGRLAVVDVGSNSTRLFLCEGAGPGGPEGERMASVTALRRGADADGRLAHAALERLRATLADYADRVRVFAPAQVVAVGTSAVREAPNVDAVAALVADALGADLTVISGEEEAALAYAGARLALDDPEPALVIDVGGGSTELVRGGPSGPEGAVSLRLGSVRASDAYLHHDPPLSAELADLRAEAAALLPGALAAVGGPARAVGVAGTVTSLAAIALGGYDPARVHRHVLGAEVIESQLARLAALPLDERREVPGLAPARAPAIVAGAAIVAQILQSAGLTELLVSERDLLDGIALSAGAYHGAP